MGDLNGESIRSCQRQDMDYHGLSLTGHDSHAGTCTLQRVLQTFPKSLGGPRWRQPLEAVMKRILKE